MSRRGLDGGENARRNNEICLELRRSLERAVKKNLASGILLSGGLDTSVLASIASRYVSLKALTVAFDEAEAPDLEYARRVAMHLGLEHNVHLFSRGETYEAVSEVVKVMRTFDPVEIRNDLAIFIALKCAKSVGLSAVMTGDGCDELFAGYSFLFNYDEKQLRLELEKMWRIMGFSSVPMAKALGVEVKLPFLDPEVKSFAMNLSPRYLVRGMEGKKWGKWIVRKAFEGILPNEIVWRVKTPIEYGTGTTMLRTIFDGEISYEEFNSKKKRYLERDRVTLRDKEQLFYYEAYRSVVGIPHAEDLCARTCPMCNSNVRKGVCHCRTCGAYPI